MPVVIGDNTISIDGKVIETVKSVGTYPDPLGTGEPTVTTEERMYPPVRNFTADSNIVTGQVYGNGTYVVSYSSSTGDSLSPFTCFNTQEQLGGHWTGGNYTSGNYNKTSNIDGTYLGDWLKIQLPVAVRLTRYGILQRPSFNNRAPKDFKIYGSTDNTNWTVLASQTTISYTNLLYEENIINQDYYVYYALVVNKLFGSETVLNFDEWFLYGQEEADIPPETIDADYNYLTFPYVPIDNLVYDFTDQNTETTWRAKADAIEGFSYEFIAWFEGYDGIWKPNEAMGFINYILPSSYNNLTVRFGNLFTSSTVTLLINGVVKSTATAGQYLTYTQTYNSGDVLRIEELEAVMNANIIITLSSTQTSYNINFPEDTECDILVVGGGGGGGRRAGGGGGAGAFIYHKNQSFNGTYNIKVGKGGSGKLVPAEVLPSIDGHGKNGSDSSISKLVSGTETMYYKARGGGGGKGSFNNPFVILGGSSGGASYGDSVLVDSLATDNIFNTQVVSVVNNQYVNTGLISPEGCRGNVGGLQITEYKGGGGGGAGSVGMSHDAEATVNDGYGGLGLAVDISGTSVAYAGGGNGSDFSGTVSQVFNPDYPTLQSRGGGGYGSDNGIAQNGLNGTGGGGGGQGDDTSQNYAGDGGSGIVIIRYPRKKIPFDAQWTYSALNTNVYHMGNVGIGITNPTNALHVIGNTFSTTYSSSSKTFKIEHPLKINKWLYHGCIEGPRFDNMYRGKKLIIEGKAEVDIDTECNTTGGMTPGTFPALNTNYQLYLQNNKTFDNVKGTINGSTINIECENTTEEIEIDWMVVGERHDEHVINTPLTDSDGNLICEHYFPGYNKDNSGEQELPERIANIDVMEEYTISQEVNNSNVIIEEDTSNTSNTSDTSNTSNTSNI
jgi:hypothetical protein